MDNTQNGVEEAHTEDTEVLIVTVTVLVTIAVSSTGHHVS